jgi:alpha-1,3-mannosyltransferase
MGCAGFAGAKGVRGMVESSTKRQFLGVGVAVCNRVDAVRHLDEAIANGELVKVAFANAHTLNVAHQNERFRTALQGFYVLNDGLGLDIASRIKFGRPFPENLNGTDFTPFYLAQSRHKLRIFLLGASPAIVATAAAAFARNHPRHTVAGLHHGYISDDDAPRVCAMIAAAKPDVVLVAMGNPLQELWIAQHAAATGAKLFFGVGALFDFAANKVPRAPSWVRSLHCEWVYRLSQEPRRLARRYLLGNPQFLLSILRDRDTVPDTPGTHPELRSAP